MRQEIHPWGTFDIDPATGLPVVPEGMFFRVRRSLMGGGYWYVQLRMRTWYGSRMYKQGTYFFPETPIDRTHVTEGAAYVLVQYNKSQAAQQRAVSEGVNPKDFLGDYPPKKLS